MINSSKNKNKWPFLDERMQRIRGWQIGIEKYLTIYQIQISYENESNNL